MNAAALLEAIRLGDDDDWRALAACRGADPSIFFPDDGDYRRAARVCAGCPVVADCREEGRNEHGWWGALGGQEYAVTDPTRAAIGKGCSYCGAPTGASGLRRPGGRWCNLACYQASKAQQSS